ncbi:hypothetical protein BSLG_001828 [Batrachochytrium salamandrivorans]|nr:hypothetical protein BSLG_001828 [Batrachochytrium salamandrivorans]
MSSSTLPETTQEAIRASQHLDNKDPLIGNFSKDTYMTPETPTIHGRFNSPLEATILPTRSITPKPSKSEDNARAYSLVTHPFTDVNIRRQYLWFLHLQHHRLASGVVATEYGGAEKITNWRLLATLLGVNVIQSTSYAHRLKKFVYENHFGRILTNLIQRDYRVFKDLQCIYTEITPRGSKPKFHSSQPPLARPHVSTADRVSHTGNRLLGNIP